MRDEGFRVQDFKVHTLVPMQSMGIKEMVWILKPINWFPRRAWEPENLQ
jgi:hypothetical protein